MNELHDGCEFHVMFATVAGRPGSKENERRAQALASSSDDVLRDLAYEHHVGLEPTPDHGIHRKHVCGDAVAKEFGLQRGLAHCGIDSTAGQEDSIFSLTAPAKGMYNFVFFKSLSAETSMYAVVRTGGKQYRVSTGEKLRIEKLAAAVGSELVLDDVLLVGDGQALKVGTPVVKGASVKAKIIAHGLGEKVMIFKLRRRKNSKRLRGHRQAYTEIEVTGIAQA
jgi:large subunit ribosomal protein L21